MGLPFHGRATPSESSALAFARILRSFSRFMLQGALWHILGPIIFVNVCTTPVAALTLKATASSAESKDALEAQPTEAGCYVMLPTGCGKDSVFAASWQHDMWGEEHAQAAKDRYQCEHVRMRYINEWCNRTDTMMLFVAQDRVLDIAMMQQTPDMNVNAMSSFVHYEPPEEEPSVPGCYVMLPTGCARRFEAPTWTRDEWGEQNTQAQVDEEECTMARKNAYEKWCVRADVKMLFVATPEEPKGECSSYEDDVHYMCGWTFKYNCPGQALGSAGAAIEDNTTGYKCCCGQYLWQALAFTPAPESKTDHEAGQEDPDLSNATTGVVGVLQRDPGSKPLALCLVQGNGNLPWFRLLMRARNHPLWEYTMDGMVKDIAIRELELIRENLTGFLQAEQLVKSIVVRDPVTRLLSAYLNSCKKEGRWKRCFSDSDTPITLSQMVTLMGERGLDEAHPLFRKQLDMCGLRELHYEAVERYEEASRTVKAILQKGNLWDLYGTSGWGGLYDGGFGDIFESDGAELKVCDYFDSQTLKQVKHLYEDDFNQLGYDPSFWTSKCAEAWIGRRRTAEDEHPLPNKGIRTMQEYSSTSGCAPEVRELEGFSRLPKPRIMEDFLRDARFYLHDSGAFNFSDVLTCFMNKHGLKSLDDNFDQMIFANVSEHLGEIWLLKALQEHPQRTRVEQDASVHIIGALPFLSYAAAQDQMEGACGSFEDHNSRMEGVGRAILQLDSYQHSAGRNFFMFTTYYRVSDVFTPSVLSIAEEGNMIVGTSDKEFTHWKPYPNIRRKVILPYKAHFDADPSGTAREMDVRSIDFLFRGQLHRTNEGAHRTAIMNVVDISSSRVDVQDVAFFTQGPAWTSELAKSYSRSRFCLSPAGDTPTSRRLFDSLAGGCVPVAMGDFDMLVANLPFKRTIDWTKIVFFAGSLLCNEKDAVTTSKWIQKLSNATNKTRGTSLVGDMSAAGQEVFHGALSYDKNGKGLVDALLRELVYEVSNVNGNRRAGDIY